MALLKRPFVGNSFFADIRADMVKNRGMFAASDGAFRYACVDSAFYQLGILVRPDDKTFTSAALDLPNHVRVVANGQVFGTSRSDYCYLGPCAVQWQGEIVVGHVTSKGNPASRPDHRHLGQWDGRLQVAFQIAKGDPSVVSSPGRYNYALGTLLPLISGSIRFGAKEERNTSGAIIQYASPGGIGSWLSKPSATGKVVYGLHRDAEIFFVLVQRHGDGGGLDITSLINRLASMGVNDAAMGDGSNSATLIVDKGVEVAPGSLKNDSIPTGITLQLKTLTLTQASSLTNTAQTTDPNFAKSFSVTSVAAEIMQTSDGLVIRLTSLGKNAEWSASQFAAALGVALPIELRSGKSSLAEATDFESGKTIPFARGLGLKLKTTAISGGEVIGQLEINNTRGVVLLDLNWPVKT